MKAGPALFIATVLGLAAAAAAIGWVGFAPVLAAAERIGWAGFAGLCLYSGFPLVLLGLGWWAVTPDGPRPAAFIWARTAREGASDVLPFAGFGGLIVGARTIARFGVSPARAWAGMVADLSTELAAQLVFTLYGVGALALMLGGEGAHPHLWPLVAAGTGAAFAIFGLFAVFQRRGLAIAGALAERMLPGAVKTTDGIAAELRASYARRRGIAAAFVLNLGAWVASGAGAWIALRLMDIDIPLWGVLSVEALIFTLRSAAFMIPGAWGVQEGAYAIIGPLFGLDPATALALSLVKRARDLAIGLPALLVWQWGEGGRWLRGLS